MENPFSVIMKMVTALFIQILALIHPQQLALEVTNPEYSIEISNTKFSAIHQIIICNLSDHKAHGTKRCPAHTNKAIRKPIQMVSPIIIFARSVLKGEREFASVEHAYQYTQCHILIKDVAVDQFLRSPTVRSAKFTASY